MAMHRWQGYDHPTLHTMINSGPGAAASTPQTTYWEALTTELAEIDADLNRKLGELGAAWEGAAGESANAGLTPLQAWATDAQSGTNMMKSSTEYQADMISRARAEMPEPVEVTTPAPSGWSMVAAGAALLTGNAGPAAAVAGQAMDHEQQEAQQDAASQKAVDTMDSYQSSSEFNRNTLGTFVPPPDVVVATPEPATTPGSAVGTWGTNFNGANANTGTTTPSGYAPPPTTGHGSFVPPPGTTGGPYTPPTGSTPTPSGYIPPGSTTPSGYVPPQITPVTPNPANPIVPSGPNGPNNPAFSGNLPLNNTGQSAPNATNNPNATKVNPGGGKGGLGQPGLGQTADASRQGGQPGKGGMAGAGGFGQHGANVTGGRGGAAGGGKGMGGGMGGRGGSAQGEEDEEYELANYLVETEDVFGDDRMVAPTVIGENPEK